MNPAQKQYCPGCGMISDSGKSVCANCGFEYPLLHDFLLSIEPVNITKHEPFSNIKVIGVGGAGTNAVNRMMEAGLANVEFWTMNTDIEIIKTTTAEHNLQIGKLLTRGLGAGGNPEMGYCSAEESRRDICKALEGAGLAVIMAGMGGGTGTGAAPVIAEMARHMGILVAAIVSMPFRFEGPRRGAVAEEGLTGITQWADTVFVLRNDSLFHVVAQTDSLMNAFKLADDAARQCVQRVVGVWSTSPIANPASVEFKRSDTNGGYYEYRLVSRDGGNRGGAGERIPEDGIQIPSFLRR